MDLLNTFKNTSAPYTYNGLAEHKFTAVKMMLLKRFYGTEMSWSILSNGENSVVRRVVYQEGLRFTPQTFGADANISNNESEEILSTIVNFELESPMGQSSSMVDGVHTGVYINHHNSKVDVVWYPNVPNELEDFSIFWTQIITRFNSLLPELTVELPEIYLR